MNYASVSLSNLVCKVVLASRQVEPDEFLNQQQLLFSVEALTSWCWGVVSEHLQVQAEGWTRRSAGGGQRAVDRWGRGACQRWLKRLKLETQAPSDTEHNTYIQRDNGVRIRSS